MNEKIKKLIGNKTNLIILVLLGVLMLVISLPVKDNKKEAAPAAPLSGGENSGGGKESPGTGIQYSNTGEDELELYAERMERKLEETLSQIAGAGKVKAMISIKASEERVVEKDEPVVRSNTAEEDSQGGKRNVNNLETKESTVYSSSGSDSEPFVAKVVQPQVEGVVVVAQGAGTGSVSKSISEAVQVLFGIEAHKVKVMKMETP